MKQKQLHGEVRFHLGKGDHYMHWQVKIKQGSDTVDVYYYDPNEYQLEMRGCRLINKVNIAKKVNRAGVKDVAGWVECDEIMLRREYFPVLPVDNLERVFYNPIRDIHWRRESDCGEFSWDDSKYATLITDNKQVYILEERDCAFDDLREIDTKYLGDFKV
jgi:hypothetical protein